MHTRQFARAHLYEFHDVDMDTRFVSDNLTALTNAYNKLGRPSVTRSSVYYALKKTQGTSGASKYKHLKIRSGFTDVPLGRVVLVNSLQEIARAT